MYQANISRYDSMLYRRAGNSGLQFPAISLGLWHNFGDVDNIENQKKVLFKAFDLGITHFDMANNYGVPAGSAERNFGRIMKDDLYPHRDEMVISTKAGYHMWEGPYGEWGSRKSILASCDQSLKRMGLDYVDLFYHHRPDPDTPLEETALALDFLVRQGKALYIGVSNYSPVDTLAISKIFRELKTPFIVHQPKYNMFERSMEQGLTQVLKQEKLGAIVFSPLAQGLLSDRYLNGIPSDSRAARPTSPFLSPGAVEKTISTVRKLNEIAGKRGQSLAQMALAWNLRDDTVTSVLIGASRPEQLEDNVRALENLTFSAAELHCIDELLAGGPTPSA